LIRYKERLPDNNDITDKEEKPEKVPTNEAINVELGFGEPEDRAEKTIEKEPEGGRLGGL
jgi:hypothetical protein